MSPRSPSGCQQIEAYNQTEGTRQVQQNLGKIQEAVCGSYSHIQIWQRSAKVS